MSVFTSSHVRRNVIRPDLPDRASELGPVVPPVRAGAAEKTGRYVAQEPTAWCDRVRLWSLWIHTFEWKKL